MSPGPSHANGDAVISKQLDVKSRGDDLAGRSGGLRALGESFAKHVAPTGCYLALDFFLLLTKAVGFWCTPVQPCPSPRRDHMFGIVWRHLLPFSDDAQ